MQSRPYPRSKMRAASAALALVFLAASTLDAHAPIDGQIARLDGEIRRAPGDATLYLRRAELHRLHGDFRQALADYRRAGRLDPRQGAVELGLGRLYLAADRAAEALEHLDCFLIMRPGDPRGLGFRGRALQALGRFAEAARAYSAAIAGSVRPGRVDPDLYLARAQALSSPGEGRVEEALTGLDEGLARLGPVPALELLALDLEVGAGRTGAALRRVRAAAARSGRAERWLVLEGEILARAGMTAEARRALDKARAAIDALPPARRRTPLVDELESRLGSALARLEETAGVEGAP